MAPHITWWPVHSVCASTGLPWPGSSYHVTVDASTSWRADAWTGSSSAERPLKLQLDAPCSLILSLLRLPELSEEAVSVLLQARSGRFGPSVEDREMPDIRCLSLMVRNSTWRSEIRCSHLASSMRLGYIIDALGSFPWSSVQREARASLSVTNLVWGIHRGHFDSS